MILIAMYTAFDKLRADSCVQALPKIRAAVGPGKTRLTNKAHLGQQWDKNEFVIFLWKFIKTIVF